LADESHPSFFWAQKKPTLPVVRSAATLTVPALLASRITVEEVRNNAAIALAPLPYRDSQLTVPRLGEDGYKG
jgi:hypothetical protein